MKTVIEYRTDFIIGLIGFLLFQATGVIFIGLLFKAIPELNGWNFHQMLFIYGFAQLPRGIDHLLTDNLWMLAGRIVRTGQFDRYLLRPIPPLFHLIAEIFQTDAVGELIIGVILMIYASARLQLRFGVLDWVLLVVSIAAGSVIYFAVKLSTASIALWTKRSQPIVFAVYTTADFAKYPIGIYPKWIRILISYIVPFAFTAFIPASYFLTRQSVIYCVGGTVIAAAALLGLGMFVWRKGLRAYESSGS
jgi:ABC-2 type transport system permease protein